MLGELRSETWGYFWRCCKAGGGVGISLVDSGRELRAVCFIVQKDHFVIEAGIEHRIIQHIILGAAVVQQMRADGLS